MPKTEGIASVTLEKVAHSHLTRFVRWKVHNDWVAELRYYDEIRSIISCSNNESSALVIGMFSLVILFGQKYKQFVSVFAFMFINKTNMSHTFQTLLEQPS